MTDFQKAREAAEQAIRSETNVIDGTCLFSAKAALDAALSAFSAHGWELVPKKPTGEMVKAYWKVDAASKGAFGRRYAALIAAAIKERT